MTAATLPPIVIDTREQTPFVFTHQVVRAMVPTGADYSLVGFESLIGIERKSLDDLVGSLTQGRERFERSLTALRTRPFRALIVEADWSDILAGRYQSRAHPSSIVGSLAAMMADGVPVVFASNGNAAAVLVERLLAKFWKRAIASQEPEATCKG